MNSQRDYTDEDLRNMFQFAHQDFERFLELKRWMSSLPEDKKAEQIDALQSLHGGQEFRKR